MLTWQISKMKNTWHKVPHVSVSLDIWMLRSLIWKILDVYSTMHTSLLTDIYYVYSVQTKAWKPHISMWKKLKQGNCQYPLVVRFQVTHPPPSNTSHYYRGLAVFPPQPAQAFWKLSGSWGRQFSFVLLQQPLTRPTHVANSLSVQDNFVFKRGRHNINSLSKMLMNC